MTHAITFPANVTSSTLVTPARLWLITISLDCGHSHLTTMSTVTGNRAGLWWCSPCGTGNHVESSYR